MSTAQANAAANRGNASGLASIPRLSAQDLAAGRTAGTAGTSGSAGTGTAALRSQLAQTQRQNQISTLDQNTLQGWMDRYGQIRDNAVAQQAAQIDYGVRQGTSQLSRTLADAQEQYNTVNNQIAADAARARDNQALYAAARGDRGGIGAAKYDSISNTAMVQQREVNNARVKLTTDVMRQIEDLRAQGEFQKADAVFDATQGYLRQLQQLEQYAKEYNLNVEQFNAQMRQQALSYAMQLEQMDVNRSQWLEEMAFQRSRAAQSDYENDRNYTASRADTNRNNLMAMIQSGYRPDDETLREAGIDPNYADLVISANQQGLAVSGTSGAASGGTSRTAQGAEALFEAAAASGTPSNFIASNYKKYGFTTSSGLVTQYNAWAKDENNLITNGPSKNTATVSGTGQDAKVTVNQGTGTPGGTVPFNYDPEEGIVTINGKSFSSGRDFTNYMQSLNLSRDQWLSLYNRMGLYGTAFQSVREQLARELGLN